MEFIYREKNIVITWAIASVISIVVTYVPTLQEPDNYDNPDFITHVFSLLNAAYACAILRFFAGDKRQSKKAPYNLVLITVWGYLWRYLVVYFTSAILLVITTFYIGKLLKFPIEVILYASILLTYPLISWLFFCENRKEKAV